jgi:hypothetical protein
MDYKIILNISLIVTMTLMSACSVKTDTKTTTDVTKKIEEDNKRNQDDIDNILNNPLFMAGGQPGKISVFGIVALEEADKIVLDERISVSQVPGKSSSDIVTTQISKDNMAVISTKFNTKSLEKLSADKTFVNLNCKQLDSSLVDGLTEVSSKPLSDGIFVISANTIVICKDLQFQSLTNSFSADHLVLVDVDSSLVGSNGGSISMNANKLTVVGKNKISTKGSDASGIMTLSAASIDLKVSKEIDGDGSLQLFSEGGNNIKMTDTKK